ncbi:MAG: hypothetical protein JST73_04670 [Actinobacteria bacterium]|nr:hypothetical protein [Actinomycetota bacterium]
MSDTCVKHSFETAVGVCRQCQNPFCAECLIYANGEKKPPYCVTCALNAAGIRHHGAAANPSVQRKGLFRRRVVEEVAPRAEKSFDDIQIELPDSAYAAPIMATTRRDVAPEILAMVQGGDPIADRHMGSEAGAVAVAAPPEGSLADWALSLDGTPDIGNKPEAAQPESWPESAADEGWPDD